MSQDSNDEKKSSSELEQSAGSMKDAANTAKKGMQNLNGNNAANTASKAAAAGNNTAAGSAAAGASQSAMSATGSSMASAAAGTAAGTAAGSAAGTAAGASAATAAGAAAGTTVGPAGTAVGAAIGALGSGIGKAVAVMILGLLLVAFLVMSLPNLMFEAMNEGVKSEVNLVYTTIVDTITGIVSYFTGSGSQVSGYVDTSKSIEECLLALVQAQHTATLTEIDQKVKDKGYDVDLTEQNTTDSSGETGIMDTAYILSVYSVAVPEDKQSTQDLFDKIGSVNFYTYSMEEKTKEVLVPQSWQTYKEVMVTHWDSELGSNVTEKMYMPDQIITLTADSDQYTYTAKEVRIVRYIKDQRQDYTATYYVQDVKTTVALERKEVKYAKVKISSCYESALNTACGFYPNVVYCKSVNGTTITNRQRAQYLASNYQLIVYGYSTAGKTVTGLAFGLQQQTPYTKEEMMAVLDTLQCSKNRKYLCYSALSLVGRVPYFWCGRTAAGWDDSWGVLKPIPNEGNDKQLVGTMWPWGLDCSGFVSWTYKTVFGGNPLSDKSTVGLYEGTVVKQITNSELLPGDILLKDGHTGLFLGYDESGSMIVIHEAGTNAGCICGPYNRFTSYWRCTTVSNLEGDELVWSFNQ